jgi:hypothetical protein
MLGVENDEAISINPLQMRVRRLLRRPAPAGLLAMTIRKFFYTPQRKGNAIAIRILGRKDTHPSE